MRLILFRSLIFMVMLVGIAEAEPVNLVSTPWLDQTGEVMFFSWRGDVWKASTVGGVISRVTSDDADERNPVISEDGATLYYASNRTGVNQVYRMDLPTSRPTQLTFHSEGSLPIGISGDGTTVFTSGQRDAWWRWANRFYSISADEPQSGEKQLFNAYGSAASVNPEGTKVLFSREGMSWSRKQYRGSKAGQIWLWDKETNEYTQPLGAEDVDKRYPIWSADGDSFYFASEKDGTRNIWHHDLRNSKNRQLTHFEDDGVISPAISSDGKTMVFRRLFDLYRLDLTKKKPPVVISLEYRGDLFNDDEIERSLSKATDASFNANADTFAFIAGGDVWISDTTLNEPVQVTKTPYFETNIVFDDARDQILFVGEQDGQVDIYRAQRTDNTKPWWRNNDFEISQMTDTIEVESGLSLSPKGNYLSYIRRNNGVWILSLANDNAKSKQVISSWSSVSYDWAPNELWMTYSASDNDFNYDVYVINISDPKIQYNLSKHPDNEFDPKWSPDGRTIAFVGRRVDREYDIFYVPLTRRLDETTNREIKLKEALKNSQSQVDSSSKPEVDNASEKDSKEDQLEYDFENISSRIRKISIPNVTEQQLTWSSDSKTLIFQSEIDSEKGTFAVTPYKPGSPRKLLSDQGTIIDWRAKSNRIYWLNNGTPGWASGTGSGTGAYRIAVSQIMSRSAYHREIFNECWRIMRDVFYDGRLNNNNWDEIYRKYSTQASVAHTRSDLSRVISMMLGELNASHLGYRGLSDATPALSARNATGHLGVRFDSSYNGPGLLVAQVIPGSPAWLEKSKLQAGDKVLSINGERVDPGTDLTAILNGSVNKETTVRIEREKAEIEIVIQPTSYTSIRSLLYEDWLENNQKRVENRSEGSLGYLHIRAMDMTSFHRFERELFEVAHGKDGIIIDVRENGGGFTTDHLLTILTQPRHAITKPRDGGRGYPQDRSIYATWSKPIIVLCNQNSHSNAEIFSHAIKYLKRGKVVGVPTSGSVISTGSRSVMDAGAIRTPFRGWYLMGTGQDMELNGAIPDVVIWPSPGELPAGKDKQLDKAISILAREVERYNAVEEIELIKASER